MTPLAKTVAIAAILLALLMAYGVLDYVVGALKSVHDLLYVQADQVAGGQPVWRFPRLGAAIDSFIAAVAGGAIIAVIALYVFAVYAHEEER